MELSRQFNWAAWAEKARIWRDWVVSGKGADGEVPSEPFVNTATILELYESTLDAPQQAGGLSLSERIAREVVEFLFDDYPDNNMNRGQGTEHVAAIIDRHLTASQWQARCVCGHLKSRHQSFSDHDECLDCEDSIEKEGCADFRPSSAQPVAREARRLVPLSEVLAFLDSGAHGWLGKDFKYDVINAIQEHFTTNIPATDDEPLERANSFRTFLAEQMRDPEFAKAYAEISAAEDAKLVAITDAELQKAQRLYKQTTQGEWQVESDFVIASQGTPPAQTVLQTFSKSEEDFVDAAANRQWIAAAHNLWPRLVARAQPHSLADCIARVARVEELEKQ